MKLEAVCLDATGTLIETAEPVGEVYHRVARAHGVDLPAWRIEDAFRRILRQPPPRGLDGDSPDARRRHEVAWWSERIRQTFQATDSTARFDDFPDFARALFAHYREPEAWRIRPGIRPGLAGLRADGHRLAVVSNFDHRLRSILQGLDLADVFDVILIPSDVGVAKPDRRIFERAAAVLGAPLERMGYVGDDPPAVLEAIARLGLVVLDARTIDDWTRLAERLAEAASLRARRPARQPAQQKEDSP